MIKLIIFDLDGTLVNAYPAVVRSVNHALTQLGFPKRSPTEIKRSVGGGDRHLMAHFIGEEFADKAIRLYRPHHTKALAAPGGVRFLPGALKLLRDLKSRGYKIAIASNRPTKFTLIILDVLGARSLFDTVLCADKAVHPKPYPDMLWAVIKNLKVTKSQTIYVGDMTIDIETGQRAGIKTVAVATGSSSMKELKDLKPWRILGRISLLKTLINTQEIS